MVQYPYQPLHIPKNEIRLLILEPGTGSSVVSAELVHESLDNSPFYEALSYTWGDPSATKNIDLSTQQPRTQHVLRPATPTTPRARSCRFQVTPNLESALRHLRLENRPRVLWVDAICINQSDPVEKGHQVGLMGRIYQNCSRVCVWLGDAASDSDLAMKLINNHAELWLMMPHLPSLLEDEELIPQWRALTFLVLRPWFTRLWVVQEIALAPADIVMCGTKTCSWAALFTGVGHLVYVRPPASSSSRLPQQGKHSLPPIFRDWNVPAGHHDRWPPAADEIYYLESTIRPIKQGERQGLRQLLARCHGRRSTEKRDAIFALLSIAGDTSPTDWNIDYEIPVLGVYQEAVANIIRTGSLDIICHASSCGASLHTHSWLPRFGIANLPCKCPAYQRKSFTMSLEEEISLRSTAGKNGSRYCASGDSIASARIEKNPPRLVVRGVYVDQVGSVLEKPKWDGSLLTIPRNWLRTDPETQSQKTFSRTDHLWRTMVADRVISSTYLEGEPWSRRGKAPEEWNRGFEEWKLTDLSLPWTSPSVKDIHRQQLSLTERFVNHVGSALDVDASIGYFRTFAVTTDSRTALVPPQAKPADHICIFLGCSVPLVLRPVPGSQSKEFHFVGESYVHGIMDGEMMTKLNDKNYPVVEFTLI